MVEVLPDPDRERRVLQRLKERWDKLSPLEQAQAGPLIEALKERRRQHPLAYATLWHRKKPRTSQRRALQRLADIVTCVFGGNRSGKSEAGAQLAAAYVLGRNHPDVIIWARRNRIDISHIPEEGGDIWSVGLTFSDSKEYIRPKLRRYLPPSQEWVGEAAENQAEVRVPGRGRCVFKAASQGRKAFQGTAKNLIWFDEDPEDEEVWNECMMRLVDVQGRILLTMTPLRGLTWIWNRYVDKPEDGSVSHWISGEDNPNIPAEFLLRLLAGYGSHEQAARRKGSFTALEGRVYESWSRELHLVPAFDVPEDWPRYLGIDWGTSVPTCILLLAYDAAKDVIHVIDEWYESHTTIPQRAEAIRAMEAGHPPMDIRWADPEDASTNTTLIRDYDIALAPAYKAVKFGINAVSARLAPDVLGVPHLVVHEGKAPNLVREIESYVWDKSKDAPRKGNDHAMDTLRYGTVGICGIFGLLPGPPIDEEALAA